VNILGLDSNTLGVDGSQISVLKEGDKVSLRGLLEGTNSARLEPQISLEILGNLTDKTLEGELADQELGRFLVPTDLTEGDGSRAVTVRLLDTTGGGRGLAGGLGSELLAGGFSSGRLAGGLLGTGHFFVMGWDGRKGMKERRDGREEKKKGAQTK
jgi:histone H3